MADGGSNGTGTDIIICVHNSPEDVRSCLTSVHRTLGPRDRIIVVDDGSADETRLICEKFALLDQYRIKLIRRPEGSGFCRAANAGLRESSAPCVVLLNSDTIVPPGWLDSIAACMAANWQIGIVGPLSNAGGWQSIPEYKTGGPPNNLVRDDLESIEAIHKFCRGFRPRFEYPIVEQVNGFCLAIRREVLDTIGLLDEKHFPMGYGEESDFNFRAQDAGFLSAVAIDCFVYHAKTKSYSTEDRTQYISTGRVQLDRLHGAERVRAAVRSTQGNPILAAIRKEAAELFKQNDWFAH